MKQRFLYTVQDQKCYLVAELKLTSLISTSLCNGHDPVELPQSIE